MVKSWLQPIFTIDSHRVGQPAGLGRSPWTALPQLITVIHFYFGADLISVISVQAFLPKLNLYLNFYSGLTDSGPLSQGWLILDPSLATEIFSVPKRRIFALPKIVRYRNKSGLQYPLGKNSKSTLYKVLQNLEKWGATEKQLASRRPQWISPRGRGAARQCSNGQRSNQLDKKSQTIGSSPDLCSESV